MVKHAGEPRRGESPMPLSVEQVANCFESESGFFIDKETLLFIRRDEVVSLLHGPIDEALVDEKTRIEGLIRREQLREWSNLPNEYGATEDAGVSFLSVVEHYARGKKHLNKTLGIEETGDLQRRAVALLLPRIPNWQDRVRKESVRVLLGPQPKPLDNC